MTRGSKIHDKLGDHFRRCGQCRDVNPEEERITRPGHRDVSAATLAALCEVGRSIYRSYLGWLAEPE